MEIGYMNQQNQIMIQEAKIVNQNYLINWLASVYHQDILVCIKSSWIAYDKWKKILQEHYNETKYQGKEIYWQKITKQTSVKILTTTIKPPIDIILLPITKDSILIPSDEEECIKLQKTIKGVIKCTRKRKTSLFTLNESIHFYNDFLPVERNEIVAEYIVENFRYPVTAGMFGQIINVQIPKNSTCQLYITKNMNSKYNLIISEE